jgi:hypothetical protein
VARSECHIVEFRNSILFLTAVNLFDIMHNNFEKWLLLDNNGYLDSIIDLVFWKKFMFFFLFIIQEVLWSVLHKLLPPVSASIWVILLDSRTILFLFLNPSFLFIYFYSWDQISFATALSDYNSSTFVSLFIYLNNYTMWWHHANLVQFLSWSSHISQHYLMYN